MVNMDVRGYDEFWAAVGGEAYRQWLARTGDRRDGNLPDQDGGPEPTSAACAAATIMVD